MSRSPATLSLLFAILLYVGCGPPPPDRIVVITLDTTRSDALGAYRQPDPTSPEIDAMAAEGLLFEQAVSSAPSTLPSHATLLEPAVRNALAWLLAAVPDPALRDGARAVRLAEQNLREGERTHAGYVDTLAAAYAETGDFERAVATQRRALEQIEGRDLPPGVADSFRAHLAALEAGRPVRDP